MGLEFFSLEREREKKKKKERVSKKERFFIGTLSQVIRFRQV